jgi:hypothetical protein
MPSAFHCNLSTEESGAMMLLSGILVIFINKANLELPFQASPIGDELIEFNIRKPITVILS